MLLQFSVTNHRSIRDTAIISMKASKDSSLKESLISPDGKENWFLCWPYTAPMQRVRATYFMRSP